MRSDRGGKAGGRPRGRTPRRKGGLTEEDLDLWSFVTRSIEPLQAPPRLPAPGDAPPPGTGSAGTPDGGPPAPSPRARAAAASARRESRPPATASRAALPPPPPADIDRRHGRRIASGRIEIEARIDLHGMVQSAAHRRLECFIRSCHAQGMRTVLVITGKGAPMSAGGRTLSSRDDDMFSERGVLRRNVPRWLAGPPLRALIASFGPASIRHGGEGALYVVLRGARAVE